MTRKLYPILFLAIITLSGCGKVKDFFSGNNGYCCQQPKCAAVEYVPENIIARDWGHTEVGPEQIETVKPSPYITGYSKLDSGYPTAEYKTWSKSNARHVVTDPVIFMKDIVTAPFKFSRNVYKDYKAKKVDGCEGVKCQGPAEELIVK